MALWSLSQALYHSATALPAYVPSIANHISKSNGMVVCDVKSLGDGATTESLILQTGKAVGQTRDPWFTRQVVNPLYLGCLRGNCVLIRTCVVIMLNN